MNRLITLAGLLLSFYALQAQQVVLYSENFENGPSVFIFNSGGPVANTGNNQWLVNDSFVGQPLYPNTPNEDSVVLGQITDAPYSHYLHIHDIGAVSSGIANDNWNTQSASSRFCYTGAGFCTLGASSVILTFFWICEGDSTAGAYGQVYYRTDGGPWTATGLPKYWNQSKWQYESIQDPGMNNVQSLQIGFLWVNPNTSDSSTVSFGIDDIIMVGNYDSTNTGPAHIYTAILDSPLCQGDQQVFYMGLSEPLCDGTYEIEMSNRNGNFSNPTDLGVLNLGPTFTDGYFGTLGTPGNDTGSCFQIRIVRTDPLPVIISDTSTCFSLIHCPNSIFNVSSVVMTDPDTACILSELDVMFNSIGVFGSNNTYIAEISDSLGNFTDSTVLGTLHVSDSFPSMPQGDVSGLIPASVPPGCGYYIRVVSTNPYTVSPPIGPFCVKDCDVLTNNITDIHFCVASGPYPRCDTIDIKPHEWNHQSSYDTCNKWEIQLVSMMPPFGIVNTGGIGVYYDSIGGYFRLCMPSSADSLPVPPGAYYMRIVSTCSNEAWNENGTIIRITIGAPSSTPSLLIPLDTVVCNTGEIQITVDPFNDPPSQYQWSSNLLNNGNSFIWPYNPLLVTLNTNVPFGIYTFYVQEINYGCVGPFSAPANIAVIGTPKVNITGPSTVCLGDTSYFNVTYLEQTYYHWTVPGGVQAFNLSNSQAAMIFDTLGTFTIANSYINGCGGDSGTYKIKVVSPYMVTASAQPQPVCADQQVTLSAIANSRHLAFTTDTTATNGNQGAMFNLVAHDTVTIDSFAVKYLNHVSAVDAEVYSKQGSYIGHEQSAADWSVVVYDQSVTEAPTGKLTVIPDEIGVTIAPGDTFGFYVTTFNTSTVNEAIIADTGLHTGVLYATDGVIDFIAGSQNVYPFGAFSGPEVLDVRIYYTTQAGMKFIWSNGDTTATALIKPKQTGQYTVQVYDTSGCRNSDSVLVVVDSTPTVNAGPDTVLCPGVPYVMQGSSNSQLNLQWGPPAGLSATNILNPVFNYNKSSSYVLSAGYPNGCFGYDTVNLRLRQIELYPGPDTSLCNGVEYVIPATSSAPNVLWSPATGLSSTTLLNPTFTATQSMVYTVSATDSDCTIVDTLSLTVECPSFITVAGAFTPNGDNVNDIFPVFGNDILSYEIRIFNRWGQEVYSFDDPNAAYLNHQDHGWDGTFKGKKEDIGTFAYVIEATGGDHKKIVKKGNFELLR